MQVDKGALDHFNQERLCRFTGCFFRAMRVSEIFGANKLAYSKGFTVIELVIAILIMGILAAVAFSRMLDGDVYNAAIVRDQIISLSRSAGQKAFGRTDVAMIIKPNGNELEIRTVEDYVDVNTYTELQFSSFDMRSVAIAADVDELDACDTTVSTNLLSNANPLVIEYDALGNLRRGGVTNVPGFPVDVTTNVRLCINNDPIVSVCISRTGFPVQGSCE